MLIHPDLMLTMANDRHRELIDQADKQRLLGRVRRPRRTGVVRGQPAGTLTSCEASAAVPAR